MRIIAGKKRNAKLNAPQGTQTRPTADRLKQGLFDMLNGGRYPIAPQTGTPQTVAPQTVADVFAGSGGLGLEAWSRGANHIVLIENNPIALKALQNNIKKLNATNETTILNQDATQTFLWTHPPADLVFLDPPWQKSDENPDLALIALKNLIAINALAPKAIIAIEHDRRRHQNLPTQIKHLETRNWGRAAITLGRYTP